MSYSITNGNRNNNSNFDSDDKNNNDYNENFTKDRSESSVSRDEERTLTPMDNSNRSFPNSPPLQGNMIFPIISLLRSGFAHYFFPNIY